MTEILFYHLTESALGQVLPSLVARSLERNWKVAILCPTEEDCRTLDSTLWNFSDRSFLPHGTEYDDYPQYQPVLLSLSEANQNGAHVCFVVAGAIVNEPQNFVRICVVFDGHDKEQLQKARTAWKIWQAEMTEEGKKRYQLTYWQQTPQRKWEKKA